MTSKAAELGWGQPAIYEDNDKSSKAGVERPEFDRMLADLKAGVRDGLLVYKADRYSREPSHSDVLKSLGLLAASEYRVFDLTTSDGMKAWRDEASAAEYETKKLSERLLSQRQQEAEAGSRHGARAFGWGYHNAKGKIKKRNKINEAEAELVREGMKRVLEKGESLASICRDWNARGVKTSRGGVWTVGSLRNVLERWSNAGVRQHQGKPLMGVKTDWEPLCDFQTLEKVRAVLSANPRNTTSTRARKHLLSGVLECECGSSMKAQHLASSLHGKAPEIGEDGIKLPTHYKCTGINCGRSVPYRDSEAVVVRWLVGFLTFFPKHELLPPEMKAEVDKATADLAKLDQQQALIMAADIEEGPRLALLSDVKKKRDAIRLVMASHASASALYSLVESLTPASLGSFYDTTIQDNFLALDLKRQKDLLQALATYTVLTGFSEPDAKGNRKKLKAKDRIRIELKPEFAHLEREEDHIQQ
jgi:DNA invertase Pin-like site-specific DNA recombinase